MTGRQGCGGLRYITILWYMFFSPSLGQIALTLISILLPLLFEKYSLIALQPVVVTFNKLLKR